MFALDRIGVSTTSSTIIMITADRALPDQRSEPEADDEPDDRFEFEPQPALDHQRCRRGQELSGVVADSPGRRSAAAACLIWAGEACGWPWTPGDCLTFAGPLGPLPQGRC